MKNFAVCLVLALAISAGACSGVGGSGGFQDVDMHQGGKGAGSAGTARGASDPYRDAGTWTGGTTTPLPAVGDGREGTDTVYSPSDTASAGDTIR
jgi:hypothetical protein